MQNYYNQPCILEVTIISAQGLKKTSSLLSGYLRPFIELSTASPFSLGAAIDGSCEQSKVYITKIDDKGGINPAWGDKFQIPLDATFFYQRQSCIYLQLYTKHLMMGRSQLGWCQIPAADIVENLFPAGSVGHLSYRLWDRDGTRGHGVVNVAVKLVEGSLPFVNNPRPLVSNMPQLPNMNPCQTVIGIPMTMHFGQQLKATTSTAV